MNSMNLVMVVTLLALIQFIFFGALVSKARRAEGVHAPSTLGSIAFNTVYRVHANTLERLVVFLPMLWMASQFWSPAWMAADGVLFLIGRMLYWKGYVKNVSGRQVGNVLSMLSIGILLLCSIAGLVKTWI